MLNLQQIFDKVWIGLKSQGFYQSLEEKSCCYRGEGGRKCAVGWLIPDDKYDPNWENTTSEYLFIEVPGFDQIVGVDDIVKGHLNELQRIHDCNNTPESMKHALTNFAYRYGLTIPSDCNEQV